jgi:hypothetical protein
MTKGILELIVSEWLLDMSLLVYLESNKLLLRGLESNKLLLRGLGSHEYVVTLLISKHQCSRVSSWTKEM